MHAVTDRSHLESLDFRKLRPESGVWEQLQRSQSERMTSRQSIGSWLHKIWFKANVFLALNMLDVWEQVLVWLLLLAVASAFLLAVYKNVNYLAGWLEEASRRWPLLRQHIVNGSGSWMDELRGLPARQAVVGGAVAAAVVALAAQLLRYAIA
ncbi:unnamed protein product [Pedinophyceae sp. YPF-701]|nr:unnamed protein product [Pedinophyceae sp. YPF-701]